MSQQPTRATGARLSHTGGQHIDGSEQHSGATYQVHACPGQLHPRHLALAIRDFHFVTLGGRQPAQTPGHVVHYQFGVVGRDEFGEGAAENGGRAFTHQESEAAVDLNDDIGVEHHGVVDAIHQPVKQFAGIQHLRFQLPLAKARYRPGHGGEIGRVLFNEGGQFTHGRGIDGVNHGFCRRMPAATGAPHGDQYQGGHDQRGSEAPQGRLQIVHHRHVSAFPCATRVHRPAASRQENPFTGENTGRHRRAAAVLTIITFA